MNCPLKYNVQFRKYPNVLSHASLPSTQGQGHRKFRGEGILKPGFPKEIVKVNWNFQRGGGSSGGRGGGEGG